MVSVSQILNVDRYQELNEPYIFSWRYLAKHLGADYHFLFDLCWHGGRRVPATQIDVTFRWRNKAHRVGEMIAYDQKHGYCLLGRANFPSKPRPTVPDVRQACQRHAQAYLDRLHSVAAGAADTLHANSIKRYQDYKKRLVRILARDYKEASQ